MTEAASELPQNNDSHCPELYLCTTEQTAAPELFVLETALWSPGEPLPLTDDDIHTFASLAHVDKQELTVHAVTAVLLRSAGVGIDYKSSQESLRTQAELRTEKELQEARVSRLAAQLLAAVARYDAAPPGANTLLEQTRQQSLLGLHDNLQSAEAVVDDIVAEIADSEQSIQPYTEVSAAVRAQEQAYNASYVTNGRANIGRILDEIVDPTENVRHPAIDLLHSLPKSLNDAMIVPERVLRMMLLDAGVANRSQDA